jgi:hypothetical protein
VSREELFSPSKKTRQFPKSITVARQNPNSIIIALIIHVFFAIMREKVICRAKPYIRAKQAAMQPARGHDFAPRARRAIFQPSTVPIVAALTVEHALRRSTGRMPPGRQKPEDAKIRASVNRAGHKPFIRGSCREGQNVIMAANSKG